MAPLIILYGSATGNARAIAQELANQFSKSDRVNGLPIQVLAQRKKQLPLPYPFTSVICSDLDSFKKLGQPVWDVDPTGGLKYYGLLIITSTTGNGDFPEQANKFARFIKRKVTAADALPFRHVAYAVLGLGDTNYDKFCEAAKVVDKKLHDLGGTRVSPLVCADEATGLEEPVEKWTDTIVHDLAKACSLEVTIPLPQTIGLDHDGTLIHSEVTDISNQDLNQQLHIIGSTHFDQPYQAKDAFNPTVEQEEEEEEEKKMDHTPTPCLSSTSKGVRSIQQLLSSTVIPSVSLASLPSFGSRLSYSCIFRIINDKDNTHEDTIKDTTSSFTSQRRKSRGMSMAEVDRMTISSGSSDTLHFTLAHPYESTILHARYLTATPTHAADASAQVLLNLDPVTTWETHITRAKDAFEAVLPLDELDPHHHRNDKRVIELTLSLPDDYTLEYQPGDSIGVLVPNVSSNISFILDMLQQSHNISPSQLIAIDANPPISLEEAMRYHFDISSTIQCEMVCLVLAQYASDPVEKSALLLLGSKTKEGEGIYQRYVEEQKQNIVDLLNDFPSCRHIPLSALISVLPLAVPRYYSICSSPLGGVYDKSSLLGEKMSHKLKIAFSVVDYMTTSPPFDKDLTCTWTQRRIGGVATRYLETICSPFLSPHHWNGETEDGRIPTWFSKIPKVRIFPRPTSDFLLPSDLLTPLVLIGPGTGIAPFMGFLAHRRAQLLSSTSFSDATVGTWRGDYEVEEEDLTSDSNLCTNDCKKLGDIDVYFGCRFKDHDWIYKDEMLLLKEEGVISNLHTCFSREKNGCTGTMGHIKYVQDFLSLDAECSKRLVHMIERNGMIFICGDGNNMAKSVQNSIINVLAREKFNKNVEPTSDSIEQAKDYVDMLKAKGRFVMDIWG